MPPLGPARRRTRLETRTEFYGRHAPGATAEAKQSERNPLTAWSDLGLIKQRWWRAPCASRLCGCAVTRSYGLWARLTRIETGLDQPTAMRLSRFAGSNLTAGCLAFGLGLSAVLIAPPHGPALWLALAWLCTPVLFAFLPRLLPHPVLCQLAALANLAGLITFLALLTGGLKSFLLPWFIVLPVEAAVSGNRRLIAGSLGLGAIGLLALLLIERAGLAPAPILPADQDWLRLLGVAGAGLYAAGLALTLESLAAEAQASIRAGEARYRLLAEHAGDLITRHAPDGRILFASPAALRLTGTEAFHLLDAYPARIAHPDDCDELMFAMLRAARLGEEGLAHWRLIRADGSALWVETSCRPAPGLAAGGAREIIAVTRDISARKEAEEALLHARDAAEAANRAKSRFLANMSHELRTPLNAIIGFSDMMRQELFGPLGAPRYRDYAAHVHESGHHLLELINDILDMAKIEAGKRDLKLERLDPQEAGRRALALVRPLAEARKLRLVFEAADLPRFDVDRRALQQILLNLLSNAIKFTPEGGRVTLSVTAERESLCFAVRDTGIGIPAEELPRLGQPFEQVDGDYARAHRGTGLGLALVRSLAELHGGAMSVESAAGHGTCVRVRLPRAAAPPEALPLKGAA
jgi:two-component system, cell cycle sensor histidine kinase DivJ